MKLFVVFLLASVVASCSTSGPDSYCLTAQPVRLSKQAIAAMDDADVVAVLVVNEYWRKRCG
jgi:hypothetical protein